LHWGALGLSAGATYAEGNDMTTKHMETEEHLSFIEKIEKCFDALG
jgi:hypothetical protein